MNATDIAAYGGLITSALGLVGIPAFIMIRKNRAADVHAEGLDSRAVAAMFKERMERSEARLDAVTDEYELKLAALKADYEQKLAAAEVKHQAQIAGLQAEVDALYRRLYQQPMGT